MTQVARTLGRVFIISAAALLGTALGYFGGAYLGCAVLWRTSNLCGLPGVVPGLPVGALAGTMLAQRLARRFVM
jgi:hypothetical protein